MVIDLYKLYTESRKKIGRDAMYIICRVFNTNKSDVIASKNIEISESDYNKALGLISRRSRGEPLQYLLGSCEFYGLEFKVGKGVLIPRADTEILVETALMCCGEESSVADLCSGSGCIAVAIKKNRPKADVYAYEISDEVLCYLRINAKENNTAVNIIKGDVTQKLTDMQFDIIVSNPPYLNAKDMRSLQTEVTYEPENALYAGDDGLDFYRKITKIWKNNIKSDGYLIYEIGMNQHEDVKNIMEDNGFCEIEFIKDLSGIIRTVKGRRRKI